MKTSAAEKPINREDRGLTIVGLVLLAPVLGVLAWYAVVVFFVGDRCNPPVTECNREIILAGHYIARFGTIAVGIVALVTSIALLRSRRRAAWIPPVALCLALCVFMGGTSSRNSACSPEPDGEWQGTDPSPRPYPCRPPSRSTSPPTSRMPQTNRRADGRPMAGAPSDVREPIPS